MTDQSRLQLTDALIEKMLAQRAGPGAPADLVPSVTAAIESTGQRAPGVLGTLRGPTGSRTRHGPGRTWLLAAGALLLVGGAVAAGSGLVRLPSLVPPVPAPTAPVAVASPTAGPTIAPSPSPSPIATPRPAAVVAYTKYVKRTNTIAEIGRVWIVGTDGTGGRELFPDGTGGQSGVAWSPDGTRLVYSESGKLYLTDASGSEPQQLDTGCVSSCSDTSAAFSSDGTRLVFVRGASGAIATLDLASGRVVELGSTAPDYNERPRWSPDGTQIIFSRQDKFGNGSAVFVVDADGRNLRRLSSAGLPARLPDWSPDGSRIVFTSLVVKYVKVAETNTQQLTQDVYTVRPDWTDLRRLTKDGNSIGATWTPDGRILFATGCRGDCAATRGIWTMDADGSNAQLLVPGGSGVDAALWGIDAAWQPAP
jgi:WD40 repeat protein